MVEETQAYLVPDWPAPERVSAVVTTRGGGHSSGSYDSNNLALHVGDKVNSVNSNRDQLALAMKWSGPAQWLEQVHGTKVVESQADQRVRTADACWTQQSGLPCVVMTADCLPILLCNKQGTQVAAVHAGWRSLARGIVRDTVATFDSSGGEPLAYLGPAIGPDHFEVGIDVLESFFDGAQSPDHISAISECFVPSPSSPLKYLANLYDLARAELQQQGIDNIYGGEFCTYRQADLFYSYRRDGVTGRMATAIWLND